MVSTLTPAALAKAPIVRFSESFFITLDSVLDYGFNVTAFHACMTGAPTMANPLLFLYDKAASLGALVSAMGCAMCFPAIASLGAALGMGFLAQWEGLFINTLLPLFAWLALATEALGRVPPR